MTQVFISYSRKDLSFVEQLATDLKNVGLDVWYDLSGLEGGTRWRKEIEKAIRESKFVVVVLSPDSAKSDWVEREYLFASNLQRKIIPLLYKPCEIPLDYLNLHYIDVQKDNYKQNFDDIIRALEIQPTPPAPKPTPPVQPPKKPKIQTQRKIPGWVWGVGTLIVIGFVLVGLFWGGLIKIGTKTAFPVTQTPTINPEPTPEATGKIVFTSRRDENLEIYVMDEDGENVARLTNNNSSDYQPKWSPDGTKIVFVSARDGNYEIYIMNADGSDQTRITENDDSDIESEWSPDGSNIVFISLRDGNREIYSMNTHGNNLVNLTNSETDEYFPSWTPDGKKIVFSTWIDDEYQNDIFIMNSNGSGRKRITDIKGNAEHPSVSPNGKMIVFRIEQNGKFDLFEINVDGTNQVQLTTNTTYVGYPSWLSDDNWVLFDSGQEIDGKYYEEDLFKLNISTGVLIQLTSHEANDFAPDWWP